MASYIEKNGVKPMAWSTFFTRTSDIPLDRSSIFGSLEDAQKYAKGNENEPDSRNLVATSYIGQIITVYENDVIDVYKINQQRELEPIGQGKGTVIATNQFEADEIANNEKSIGQFIYRSDIKTLYFVQAKNIQIKMFAINNSNEMIIDCGTF